MSEDTFHLGIKALIRNKRGEILLLHVDPAESGGKEYWDIPGGRVQRGYGVEETLRREIEEETGVREVAIGKHVGMVLSPIRLSVDGGDVGLVLSVYECTIPNDVRIVPNDGMDDYAWLSPVEAAKRLKNKYPAEFCELISGL
jgi:ADP-ribose pyrophosphatase YjhB (NUDIX family)